MTEIVLDGVGKVYPDGTRAVTDLSLQVDDGEFMVFVGPSGCGKTTALRMLAGLEEITEGEIRIGGRTVNDLNPQQRDIAMVFQNYALYPHMSVGDNIGFPLRAQRVPKAERRRRVAETASLLDLTEHLKRRPRNLSGGQRQRVAMGRALVRQPQVFLMDEPLSNLDAKLRVEMRGEIAALQKRLGITTIYVTHDQVEAMTMGSRIAVMRKGVLQQEGAPYTLYDTPANLFVAEFIGSPPMNLFRATLERGDGGPRLVLLGQQVALPAELLDARPALASWIGREIAVGIRPEYLQDGSVADPDLPRLAAEVWLVETLGPERQVHVFLPASPVAVSAVVEEFKNDETALLFQADMTGGERRARAIARFAPDASRRGRRETGARDGAGQTQVLRSRDRPRPLTRSASRGRPYIDRRSTRRRHRRSRSPTTGERRRPGRRQRDAARRTRSHDFRRPRGGALVIVDHQVHWLPPASLDMLTRRTELPRAEKAGTAGSSRSPKGGHSRRLPRSPTSRGSSSSRRASASTFSS